MAHDFNAIAQAVVAVFVGETQRKV